MNYTHVLHAFAPVGAGILLWVEQADGHAVVLDPRSLDETQIPPQLVALLASRPARARSAYTMATPKGKLVTLRVPTQAYTPEESVPLMVQMCSYVNHADSRRTQQEIGGEQLEHQGDDLRGSQALYDIPGIGGEVVYLCDLFSFAEQLVRAGRIMFRMDRMDTDWFPRWVVSVAGSHHRTVQQFREQLPGVLRHNGTDVDELLNDFIHWIAVHQLRHADGLEQELTVDFTHSLAHGRPARKASAETAMALNQWRQSAEHEATELTLMLSAPDDMIQLGVRGAEEGASDKENTNPHWRMDIALSISDGPITPLVGAETPKATREVLRQMLQRLVSYWPDLHDRLAAIYAWLRTGVWLPGPDVATGNPLRDRMVGIGLSIEQVSQLLDTHAAQLQALGINVMIPRQWARQRPNVRVRTTTVGQGPGSGKLGLEQLMDFSIDISMDGNVVDKKTAQAMIDSATSIVNINGSYVHLDASSLRRARAWLDTLYGSASNNPDGKITLQDVLEANAASSVDDEAEHQFRVINDGWVRLLSDVHEHIQPQRAIDIPPTVLTPLRDHQQRGVNWLAWMLEHQLGVILADDMGLGKTLQVLALIAWEKNNQRTVKPADQPDDVLPHSTLVVAPTSVLNAWLEQTSTHVPSLTVMLDHGPKAPKKLTIDPATAPDIVVTSYGRVARNPQRYLQYVWGRVVADEAQAIKNPATAQSQAVRRIPAQHHIALTGTPVENRLSDLYAIMDFANPGILGTAPAFQNRLAIPIERYQDPRATAMLRNLVHPFILRRLKTDENIGLDLPAKQEITELVDLTAEQAALYKAYIQKTEQEMEEGSTSRRAVVLGALVRIKQICNHPAHYSQDGSGILRDGQHRSHRIRRVFEILEQAQAEGRRALLFTQFPSFGKMLIPALEKHFNMDIPLLHGGLSRTQRDQMVQSFQQPDGPRFMMLSVKAGGTGITLTEASVVVHIDRWWNPAVEDQATDRAYRIGQNKDVTVYKLVARGTLDERINDVILGKRELAGNIVGAGEGWIANLSDEELAELWTLRTSSEEAMEGNRRS